MVIISAWTGDSMSDTIEINGVKHVVDGNENIATDDIAFPSGSTATLILKSNGQLTIRQSETSPAEAQELNSIEIALRDYAGQPPLITPIGTLKAFLHIHKVVASGRKFMS